MMNKRTDMRVLLALTLVLFLAGCGDGADSDATSGAASSKDAAAGALGTDEGGGLRTLVGPAVRATEDEVVITGPDGENVAFRVLPDDLASVDPAHVQSHVGVAGLAFRISFYEQGDERFATAVEEVNVTEGT